MRSPQHEISDHSAGHLERQSYEPCHGSARADHAQLCRAKASRDFVAGGGAQSGEEASGRDVGAQCEKRSKSQEATERHQGAAQRHRRMYLMGRRAAVAAMCTQGVSKRIIIAPCFVSAAVAAPQSINDQ